MCLSELNDCYRLYNKKTLRGYTISYKIILLFLSNLENNLILLKHLIEEFNVRNIDLSIFIIFIEKDEFFDFLLVGGK